MSKTIAQSEQLGRVSLEADYLFGRCIPHLDREGRMTGNPELVRAQACPLRPELTTEKVAMLIAELAAVELVIWYEVGARQCLTFPGFDRHQKGLRKDREATSRIPPADSANAKPVVYSRPTPEDSGRTPAQCNVMEVKGSEVKGSSVTSNGQEVADPKYPGQRYYTSKHWLRLRKRIRRERNYTCDSCGVVATTAMTTHGTKLDPPMTVHHKHYNTVGREMPEDVALLCATCHKLHHASNPVAPVVTASSAPPATTSPATYPATAVQDNVYRRIFPLIREHLWKPDGVCPVEISGKPWTEAQEGTVIRELHKAYSVSDLEVVVLGLGTMLRGLAEAERPEWLPVGAKASLRAIFHTRSGVVQMVEKCRRAYWAVENRKPKKPSKDVGITDAITRVAS